MAPRLKISLLALVVIAFAGIANVAVVAEQAQPKNVQRIAAAAKASYRSAVINPLMAESKRRIDNLLARAQMELSQLRTISNRAISLVHSRSVDASIDQQLVKGSRQRLRSLLRSADMEIRRLHKVKNRDTDEESDKIRTGPRCGTPETPKCDEHHPPLTDWS